MIKEVPPEVLVQRLQEFIKLWQKYIDLFEAGLEGEGRVEKEKEAEFRKLCVELTVRAQFLRLAVPDNIFDLSKDIRKLVSEIPTIEILRKEVPIRISAFKNQWHEVSIALNQKQGHLRNYLEEKAEPRKKRR